MKSPTLDDLRRYAVARSLFSRTTLPRAIARLGFVQADPIRAPARAQDLTLRHRVLDYRAGALEARYPRLAIEEDYFVNYGFLPRQTHALMHPRTPRTIWPKARCAQAQAVLDFVCEHGVVHPRQVDAHFAHGTARNWFGGNTRASTQLLDGMHYRGLLRIARREGGVRLYAARESHPPAPDPAAALDALVDLVVGKYAPLPERALSELVSHLRYGAPQWADGRSAALARATEATVGPRRRADLVLAGGRQPGVQSPRDARPRVPARTFRPRRLGPPQIRGLVGLGLALRSLHAGSQTRSRLLRAAAVVARPRHRLGQPGAGERPPHRAGGAGLRGRRAAARTRISRRARRRAGAGRSLSAATRRRGAAARHLKACAASAGPDP